MFFWLPCSSCGGFAFQFYLKHDAECSSGCRLLVEVFSKLEMCATCVSESPPLLLWWFVIQCSLNCYRKCMPNAFLAALLLWFLIQLLLETDAKCFSGCHPSSCGSCLFSSHWKQMSNALLVAFLLLVLIQFLQKNDVKYSYGCFLLLLVVFFSMFIETWC